jgi:hypothetical protein
MVWTCKDCLGVSQRAGEKERNVRGICRCKTRGASLQKASEYLFLALSQIDDALWLPLPKGKDYTAVIAARDAIGEAKLALYAWRKRIE